MVVDVNIGLPKSQKDQEENCHLEVKINPKHQKLIQTSFYKDLLFSCLIFYTFCC
jgi:hypothetical protein